MRVARSGLLSLDTLANVFVKAIFIVKFRMCEQDVSCALENKVMGELREHVEFGSLPNKNISPLQQYPLPPNFAAWRLTMRDFHP